MNALSDLAPLWPELSALIDEALELPAEQRLPWLDRLSHDRAPLKETLRRLIEARARMETSDFLATLPGLVEPPAALSPAIEPHAGASVGPYRLISELGQGGMGAVWLAERADGQLKRQVALKLPHLRWGHSLAERMARERDILAALEHPNIARLYDAGVDAMGRPWLALEHVRGRAIDVFAREQSLGVPERLALLLQVCSAVAYAHGRLVIHRDLKPSNILVTEEGQVKLLDFGIAKLMHGERAEATELTRLGGRAFTLDYASPEQVRGEALSTASDVYGLGVVAYALLCGQLPYKLRRGSAAELEEAIAEVDPPAASSAASDGSLRKRLRGDLDAVLAKALRKSAAERYQTAAALAEDFERHLRGDPVAAQPDRWHYRAGKFVRRHRWSVGVAGVAALTLCVTTGTALWQAGVARQQAQLALDEIDRQFALRDLYSEGLSITLATRRAQPQALLEPGAGAAVIKQALETTRKYYGDQPKQWAAALEAAAVRLHGEGDYEGSRAVSVELLDVLERLDATPRHVIYAHGTLARTLYRMGRLRESEAIWTAARRRALGVDDPNTAMLRLYVVADLGNMLTAQGRRAEALSLLLQASQAASADAEFSKHEVLMNVLVHLSRHHQGFDDRAALTYARQADEARLANAKAPPLQSNNMLRALATALVSSARFNEAETVLRQARALPLDPPSRLATVSQLVSLLANQGDFNGARSLLAFESQQRPDTITDLELPCRALLDRLALTVDVAEGDVAAVAAATARGPELEQARQAWMHRVPDLALTEAQALVLAGRSEDALAYLDRLTALEPFAGEATSLGVRLQLLRISALLATGQPAIARSRAAALSAVVERHGGSGSWSYRVANELKAQAEAAAGDTAAAVRTLQALEPASAIAPSTLEGAESALRQAQVLLSAGQRDSGRVLLDRARSALGSQHGHSPRRAMVERLAAAATAR